MLKETTTNLQFFTVEVYLKNENQIKSFEDKTKPEKSLYGEKSGHSPEDAHEKKTEPTDTQFSCSEHHIITISLQLFFLMLTSRPAWPGTLCLTLILGTCVLRDSRLMSWGLMPWNPDLMVCSLHVFHPWLVLGLPVVTSCPESVIQSCYA